jgi:neurotransmitter:Na+ symporter, NSS family
MTKTARENWSSKLSFILASVGSAIGLGAMWKLPYTIGQNGGGAFIILFIAFNFLIGLPLFIGELILGRESKKGVVSAFISYSEKGSAWSGVGWLTVLVVSLILGWYCVVAGWGICYVFLALTDAFQGLSQAEVSASFDVFRQSGSLNITFQIMFIALNAVILLKGLNQGIEKWSKFMTSALFLVLIALASYSMQLEGFAQAAEYLFYPDFAKLSGRGILSALGLALFTLSLAYGAVLTYGSYLKPDEDIPKTASIVVAANIVASLLIAIAIFPMIFTFGFAPESGEGLIFKTLPYVFEQLPGSMIIAVVFFILLLFAALTSSLAMFEVVVANFTDLGLMTRRTAVLTTSVVIFILGLPVAVSGEHGIFPSWERVFGTSYMETANLLIDWLLVIIAFFTTIFIGYRLSSEVRTQGFLSGTKAGFLYGPWLILLRVAVPFAIVVVMAQRAQLMWF